MVEMCTVMKLILILDKMDADKHYKYCYACGKQDIPKNKIICTNQICRKNLKQAKDQAGVTSGNTFELRPAHVFSTATA